MLFVIRHGRVDFPEPGAWVGRLDPPLSAAGAEDVAALLPFLATLEVPRILTSPLGRARQSAQILADGLGLEVEVASDLLEMDLGQFSGHAPGTISALQPDAWSRYLADTVDTAPPDGETFAELAGRVVGSCVRIENDAPALLVTHTGPLLALACHAMGIPYAARVHLHPPTSSVTKLTLDPRRLYFFGHTPALKAPAG